jgi:hypothetical protein
MSIRYNVSTSGCTLALPDRYCPFTLRESLGNKYTSLPLQRYLQQRNQWSPQIVRYINWLAHGDVFKKQITSRIHSSKLVHDILPTNVMLNKYDAGCRMCPCCPEISEDRDHVARCPSGDRNRWRHKFLSELQSICITGDTYPPLQTLLLDSHREWLSNNAMGVYKPEARHYSEELQPAVDTPAYPNWLATVVQWAIFYQMGTNARWILLPYKCRAAR